MNEKGFSQKVIYNAQALQKQTAPTRAATGNEELNSPYLKNVFKEKYGEAFSKSADVEIEEWIASTTYDLQTNGTNGNRISMNNNDDIQTVWTMSTSIDPAFPDRGTGYAFLDGASGDWETNGGVLEVNTRTGWPNHGITFTGREVIINHTSPGNNLMMLIRENNVFLWTESQVPTNIPQGLLWPRMAISGNTIHLIAVTTPVGNNGSLFEGLDPALLYFRSSDAGDNWDITDHLIMGIDSSQFVRLGADSYAIEARENTVAFAVFNSWADIVMLKSVDNGENWSKSIVNDFPLHKYNIDDGYSLTDIGGVDPDGPGALAGATLTDSMALLVLMVAVI